MYSAQLSLNMNFVVETILLHIQISLHTPIFITNKQGKSFQGAMREFFLSPKQQQCPCASSIMGSEIFHKSEVAFVRTRKQTIASCLVMQPTYRESVMFVANYCRTPETSARQMCIEETCRGVFEISVHLPLLNLLPDLIISY